MAKRKPDSSTKVRQEVLYPTFDTLEEQKAFQWGLAIAFNSTAECQNATAKAVISKGEDILKGMGWNGKMSKEVKE